MNNFWFIIPARKGSKRFPYKNRRLVPIVLNQLKNEWLDRTIISTNDEEILRIAEKNNIASHNRSEKNSSDKASMKETLAEIISDCNIDESDFIVCLYPTYPQRTIEKIEQALKFFKSSGASSMLCKKDIKSHPYLCLEDIGENKGKPFIENNLYRWQDFPKCFQYSHFISILKVSEINNLNYQLFNKDTVYFNTTDIVDVDSENDFNDYLSLKEKDT